MVPLKSEFKISAISERLGPAFFTFEALEKGRFLRGFEVWSKYRNLVGKQAYIGKKCHLNPKTGVSGRVEFGRFTPF